MPSPERPQGEPSQEPEQQPYLVASRFAGEAPAGQTYQRAQQAIFAVECDLSVYRFQLDRVWHVAVLGLQPDAELDRDLRALLAAGTGTEVPDGIVEALFARRNVATRRATWLEGHYNR